MSNGDSIKMATNKQVWHVALRLVRVLRSISQERMQRRVISGNGLTQLENAFEYKLIELGLLNPYWKERNEDIRFRFFPVKGSVPPLRELITNTARRFPGIKLTHAQQLVDRFARIPQGMHGIGVFPKLVFLGKQVGVNDPYGAHYEQLVEFVFERIAESGFPFCDDRKGKAAIGHIQLHSEAKDLLIKLEAETPDDVLVLPFSLGNQFPGWSTEAARWEALNSRQLPLGAAQIGCLLLGMLDHLDPWREKFIDLPADEYKWEGLSDSLPGSCMFVFRGSDPTDLQFGVRSTDIAVAYGGSATALLEMPQT